MTPRLLLILLVIGLALAGAASISAQDTAAQACVPTLPEGWVVYIIQPDDTLSEIAERSGSTVAELQRANCLDNPRRIVAGSRLFVPHEPTPRPLHHFLRRCLNAGFTMQQCRRIYNALHDDRHPFAERCLNAGFTPEECRRIYNALHDDPTLAERCRAAGLSVEECRRILNGGDEPGDNLPERCRNAGLTAEECRRAVNASQEGDRDESQRRDQDRDRATEREQPRDSQPDARPEPEPTRESRNTRGG